jgi:hypothetical protein
LAEQQAEIEQLRALLAAKDTSNEASSSDKLASVLEALSQRLTRAEPPVATKSTKIPDPPILTDGKDPTFENWKLQMQGKLRVNADHYPTEEA